MYTVAQADTTTGLVGWWKFDEGAGTIANDSSGNGNTGILMNGSTWTTGKVGNGAVQFDGVNDYVMTGPIQPTTFTGSISMWIYRNSDTNQHFVFDARGTDSSGTGYTYMLGQHSHLTPSSGTTYVNGIEGNNVSVGGWYHVVVSGITLNIPKDFKIGAEHSGYLPAALSWDGTIDDVRVYNRTLSDYDVTELYYLGLGLTPPLPFDDSTLPPSDYKLAAGPWTVEKFSNLVQSTTLVTVTPPKIFRHPITNEVHYLCFYFNFAKSGTLPFQILDLNMDTGEYRLADCGLGRPYIDKAIVYPFNGKVYIPTQDPGLLTVYDPITGAAHTIKSTADTMAWFLTIGDDLKIYMGEAVKGYLESYDPSKDPGDNGADASWTNYGIVGDPGPPYYRYIYRAGCDARYAYMGIRDQNRAAIWYLVIKDLVTGQEQKFFENDPTITSIYPYSSRRGYGVVPVGYYDPVNYIRPFYRFDGFVQGQQVDPNNLPGSTVVNIPDITLNPAGYVVDESGNTPDSSNNGTASIKWKKPGDTDWRVLEVNGIRIDDVPIRGVYSHPDVPVLLGLPEGYEPSFAFHPTDDTALVLGTDRVSHYSALYSQIHRKWYLVGYPSAWAEYDPAQPWTLKPGMDYNDTTLNPHWLPQNPGNIQDRAKYYYFAAEDKYGFIYLGGHHERESTGGSLNWYNPTTKEGGALRDPFIQYAPNDVVSALDGEKIVYSGEVTSGSGDGKLFVVDAATKSIEREITSPLASISAGTIIETDPGIIIGGQGTKLYKADIRTGAVLSTRDAPNTLFGSITSTQRKFARGPDECLWVYSGDSDIYRIHPVTLAMEKVLTGVSPAGGLTFHGTDLYIAGGSQTYIRRVKGLFSLKSIYGDVNSDGQVSAYDAALTARYAVGYTDADFKNAAAADVDNIPGISAYDAALIAQRAVGLISKFPVEP